MPYCKICENDKEQINSMGVCSTCLLKIKKSEIPKNNSKELKYQKISLIISIISLLVCSILSVFVAKMQINATKEITKEYSTTDLEVFFGPVSYGDTSSALYIKNIGKVATQNLKIYISLAYVDNNYFKFKSIHDFVISYSPSSILSDEKFKYSNQIFGYYPTVGDNTVILSCNSIPPDGIAEIYINLSPMIKTKTITINKNFELYYDKNFSSKINLNEKNAAEFVQGYLNKYGYEDFTVSIVADNLGKYIPPFGYNLSNVSLKQGYSYYVTEEQGLSITHIDGQCRVLLPEMSNAYINSDLVTLRSDGGPFQRVFK